MATACFQPRLTTSTLDFAPVVRPSGDDPPSPVVVTTFPNATLDATFASRPFSRRTVLGLVRAVTTRMGRYASRRHRGSPSTTPETHRIHLDSFGNDGLVANDASRIYDDELGKDEEPIYSDDVYESPESEPPFSFVKVNRDGSSIRSAPLSASTARAKHLPPTPSASTYETPPSLLAVSCGRGRGFTIHIRAGPFSADSPPELPTACDSVYAHEGWHAFVAEEVVGVHGRAGIDDEDHWSVESLLRVDAPSGVDSAASDHLTWNDYVPSPVDVAE